MADVPMDNSPPRGGARQGWLNRLVAAPGFQRWAARFPLTRRHVRKEGEAIFDLVAGFAHSQVLRALIEFDVLVLLRDDALPARTIAARLSLPEDRTDILLRAAVALGLLRLRGERFQTSIRGAALLGVPGLVQMIQHHDILYRDLSDPAAFFRGDTETELAGFWPYVFGEGTGASLDEATRYSRLMSDSQGLVAQDALAQIDFRGVDRLMDVGGGTGVFLSHVAAAAPEVGLTLFDLPQVMPAAREALSGIGLSDRIALIEGSFKTDPLPPGADAISLIRVLYDHDDAQVAQLLSKCFDALPKGGRLIISEPMTGGDSPHRAGDVYFALYCMAMRTGRARSQRRIAELASEAGFAGLTMLRSTRPFVTSSVLATR